MTTGKKPKRMPRQYKQACRWIAQNQSDKISPKTMTWPDTVYLLGDVFGVAYDEVKADVKWELMQRTTHAGGAG